MLTDLPTLYQTHQLVIIVINNCRGYQSDNSVDGPGDNIDCGQEWPDCDNPDVPRYRKFYQV